MPLPQPFIPGCDLAGVVETVGAGVTRFKPGDRVWGSNQGLLGRQGTMAEYACVEEGWLYPTPDGVGDREAAAVALVGITAHVGLFRCAHLQAGETVFVNGGTGGVGSMVVQMTKAVGSKVIATVGSADKAKLCQSWGADRVVNYKTDNVDAAIKQFTGDKGVNVWYETQREPDFLRMVPLMATRGRMVIMAGRQAQPIFPVGPFYTNDLSLFGFAMFKATKEEQQVSAGDINRWLAEKKLHPQVGKVFPLAQAAAAHKFLEDNTLHQAGTLAGKVIVEIG
jgi:NADPH2:quinone reductase